MDTTTEQNSKKGSLRKVLIIIFISLIGIPLAILGMIYGTNKSFRNKTNRILAKTPGVVGDHFRNMPTDAERAEMIYNISNYLINLEPEIAADKMYIIKKDDEKLYVDISRQMGSISSNKLDEILLKVRNLELRRNLVVSLNDEVQEDNDNDFLLEVARFEKQDIFLSLSEIDNRYSDREFIKILSEVKQDRVGQLLYYTNEEKRNHILEKLSEIKRDALNTIISERQKEVDTLVDIAKVYENKPMDTTINAIGSTETYSIYKLGVIYKNLSPLKSAEILLNIQDDEFEEELFSEIINEENLLKFRTSHLETFDLSITGDISKAMEFLSEYGMKIKDLVAIYEKMSAEKVAKITGHMIKNEDKVTMIELSTEEVYNLSDRIIIIDVLSKMKNQSLSKILDFMEPDVASQITRFLAEPKKS